MEDILKIYCKVPRGFVKAKGRAEAIDMSGLPKPPEDILYRESAA